MAPGFPGNRIVWTALVALALAGCSAQAPPESPASTQAPPAVAPVAEAALAAGPPAPGERTLQAVPQWRLGEWWQYRITDLFTGETFEATRVVAGTFGAGDYLVGFPLESFSDDALVLHIPGVGDISRRDLSFEVHDIPFHPLQFPLFPGATWETAFEGRNGTVLVSETGSGTARLSGSGDGWAMEYTYDADAGEIVQLHYPGYMTLDVVAHGFGYAGPVRVPHAHDLIFQHGRAVGPLSLGLQPETEEPVSETVQVEGLYDRASFVIILGNVLLPVAPGTGTPLPAAGFYQETALAPDGTTYELSLLPNEAALKLEVYGADNPVGPWSMRHLAAGPGIVLIEGIGYHSIDVRLPEGCTLPGPNAGHHGHPCAD